VEEEDGEMSEGDEEEESSEDSGSLFGGGGGGSGFLTNREDRSVQEEPRGPLPRRIRGKTSPSANSSGSTYFSTSSTGLLLTRIYDRSSLPSLSSGFVTALKSLLLRGAALEIRGVSAGPKKIHVTFSDHRDDRSGFFDGGVIASRIVNGPEAIVRFLMRDPSRSWSRMLNCLLVIGRTVVGRVAAFPWLHCRSRTYSSDSLGSPCLEEKKSIGTRFGSAAFLLLIRSSILRSSSSVC